MRWWGGRESHRREGGREGREHTVGQMKVGKLESRECVGCERCGSEGTVKESRD